MPRTGAVGRTPPIRVREAPRDAGHGAYRGHSIGAGSTTGRAAGAAPPYRRGLRASDLQ